MSSILLEDLPEEYSGYLIRTDYRIGIQIEEIMGNEDLDFIDRYAQAFDLLYGNGVPEFDIAYKGLCWFMSGGVEPTETVQTAQDIESDEHSDDTEDSQTSDDSSKGVSVQEYDFEFDSGRIYSGFRKCFNMDISRMKMHWFEFLFMLGDLSDCAFTQVIECRTADLTGMSAKQKLAYRKMKRRYEIPTKFSDEGIERLKDIGLDASDLDMYTQ